MLQKNNTELQNLDILGSCTYNGATEVDLINKCRRLKKINIFHRKYINFAMGCNYLAKNKHRIYGISVWNTYFGNICQWYWRKTQILHFNTELTIYY